MGKKKKKKQYIMNKDKKTVINEIKKTQTMSYIIDA
jgi:hypothetical protein